MDELIPIVNKLQDIFTTVATFPYDLDLPQIVVVGNQSSGKSSVLEAIVGKNFLPRGSGICTRRPLILQLRKSENEEAEDYGVFNHCPNKKMKDFDQIRDEIIRATNKETGSNSGVSAAPIGLKLFSRRHIDLTLVDLPGITKLAVGDQPSDIEKQIREIVVQFAASPESVILAVTPANVDIATSDALQIAKELDPLSLRTVGVLTKVDIMDKGLNVIDILSGKVFPLKHGYFAVRNRSQMEINQNVTVSEGIEKEESFFIENPLYRKLAKRTGITNLKKCLNRILISHIQKFLPKLRFHIRKIIGEVENEFNELGKGHDGTRASQSAVLLSAISRFSSRFADAIEGKERSLITTKELYGGARISNIFHSIFSAKVMAIDPFESLSDADICTAIQNATGTKPSLFVPEMSFETLSKRQVMRLTLPAVQCVEMVFGELMRVARNCNEMELKSYPKLQDRIADCVSNILAANKDPALKMVHCLIEIELAYINTNHPDFIGGSNAVPSVLQKLRKDKERALENEGAGSANKTAEDQSKKYNVIDDRKTIEIEIIKSLINSYFQIVQKNILDSVPKSIMHFLVNKSKKDLQSSLVSELYREDYFDELLEEDGEIVHEKKRCKGVLEILNNAMEIIESVREYRIKN